MIEFLEKIAREAGAELLELQHTNLTRYSKGSFDYATEADLRSQALLIARLDAQYPGVAVLAEEQVEHSIPDGSYFAIDPLDGTIGYSAGSNSWGVIITYMDQGTPHAGVIFLPKQNLMVTAQAGAGAQLNGAPVKLRTAHSLAASLAGLDIGAWLSDRARENAVLPLIEKALAIRSLGSSAASTADLAKGVTSLYVSAYGAKIWDLATCYLVVTEAGGVASDLFGDELRWNELYMSGIFAAGAAVQNELVEIYHSTQ